MSTQPFTSSRYQALNSNGYPLAGGKLYTYAAGTSTPLATYTTRAGTIANANPVILDANGEADVWLQSGVDYKFVLKDASDVLQSTVDNWPSPSEASASTDTAATEPGGRLTLALGVPTSGALGAAVVYYAPYKHDKVPLYDGTGWALYSIGAGLSNILADTTKNPAAVAPNANYDLFVWNDSGILRLCRGSNWGSNSARGASQGLVQVNGRYVNAASIPKGPPAQLGLYVGTVRSDGSALLNDSSLKRNVWNNYNRVRKAFKLADATALWASGTANVYRQVRNTAANLVEMVFGQSEDSVRLEALLYLGPGNVSGTGDAGITGIGLNSATVNSASVQSFSLNLASFSPVQAVYDGWPGLGFFQAYWLECYEKTAQADAFAGVRNSATGSVPFGVSGMTGNGLF